MENKKRFDHHGNAERYEQYYLVVKNYMKIDETIQLLKLPKYSGFAFGVRTALLNVKQNML